MGILKQKFIELSAQGRSLTDTVVLAQAWKKSHTYIRRHNWYADVLALDVSTIDLENKLNIWGDELQNKTFKPEDLRLVPVPKNAKWVFKEILPVKSSENPPSIKDLLSRTLDDFGPEAGFKDWQAKRVNSNVVGGMVPPIPQKLRPLAHITVRDQTLATAVMMCLADAIETAQGDTTEMDFSKARESDIVSYGNRLQCQWLSSDALPSRAKFSWGNSRTYRQFYEDYRNFLARPRQVCAQHNILPSNKSELYVVSLDLKSFFDQIDITALINELKRLEETYRDEFGLSESLASDKGFWEYVDRIFSWKWHIDDHKDAPLINGNENEPHLPLGLPQGLVASGFLANAYLVGLDKCLNQDALANKNLGNKIKLIDYCRYVDDIRMVVEAPSRYSGEICEVEILNQVISYVNVRIKTHLEDIGAKKSLTFSKEKCTITPYRSISTQGDMSAMMGLLQAELSGTFDLESLMQTTGGLDSLLLLSDQLEGDKETPSFRLNLATIAVPNTDVRDDTVKRFVAPRLAQSLRDRLAMTDINAPIGKDISLNDQVTQGTVLVHEFEATARKLIKCWADNPALVLLLRCGLNLYPHPKLLTPVIEALSTKLFKLKKDLSLNEKREVRVAQYVAADLLRAGVVETGHRDKEEYPESIDIPGYREELASFARRLVQKISNTPWYLQQQIRLFLASVQDYSLSIDNEGALPELLNFSYLRHAMLYEPTADDELVNILPIALIAQQVSPNPARFVAWLREGLHSTNDEDHQKTIVKWVSLYQPELLYSALQKKGRKPAWNKLVPQSLIDAARQRQQTSVKLVDGREYSLLQVMSSKGEVLSQENGLLALAKSLLEYSDIQTYLEKGLTAAEIRLKCNHWDQLQSLDQTVTLEARIDELPIEVNPLYSSPSWVSDDKAWIYGLGRILRAALTGEFDFTSRRYLVTEDVCRYSGLRSTWFNRRFGLLNNGHGLLDEPTPISPWLSGFLSTILQWPGVDFNANGAEVVGEAKTSPELLAHIEARITAQRKLYGQRSATPMYIVPCGDQSKLIKRPVRIAIVQPLFPKMTDFDVKDPCHWTKKTLAVHRRHLAEVCKLIYQQLRSWASAKFDDPLPNNDSVVDIVLFPELSIHPEDVRFLRRLSDQLRTNIFTGLTFIPSHRLGAPINQGLWLIRTEEAGHGRSIQYIWQGKQNPTEFERKMGVEGYRPHITLLELPIGLKSPTRIAAAICYDATDLDLITDLRDRSDIFLVAAFNKDVQTFDNMAAALHFHMYQPVVLANIGEFGGSTAQAPLPKHERLISHMHGNNQLAISVFEIDPEAFKSITKAVDPKEVKMPPAGYKGRPL